MGLLKAIAGLITRTFAPRVGASNPNRERVAASYDAAQTTRHNQNHWGDADYLSPNASTTVWVRHTLRSRSRLEAQNNSLYAGVCRSLADHTVGTGPSIEWLHRQRWVNTRLDRLWREWDDAAGINQKLWLAKETQVRDGEIFGLTIGNPKLRSRIKLDYQLLEADYVTSLRPVWTPWQVDGITYDTQWNAVSYQIVTQRPNDIMPIVWPQQHNVDASQVWHYFRRERPGQGRGVPEMVAAFEILAVLRRFWNATVSAAETAASLAIFLKSNGPASAESATSDAWLTLEIQRNLMTMLPDGYEMQQLDAKQPTQSFTEFIRSMTTLMLRCVSIPLNLALCDSSGYNYSSSRMDHQTFWQTVAIDRRRMELSALCRIVHDFLKEAELLLGFRRGELSGVGKMPYETHWPRPVSVDPQKDAAALSEAVQAGHISITDAQKKANTGGDVVRENAEFFGVSEDDVRKALFEKLFGNGGSSEKKPPIPDEAPTPAPAAPAPPKQQATRRRTREGVDLACAAAATEKLELQCAVESAQLNLAAAEADGSDPAAVPKFAMVGYTGGPMWLDGHEYQLVIDLASIEVASPQTPILFGHDDEQPLGHATQVTIDASGIRVPAGQGFFSAANARRDEVVNSARQKYPWQASVGGRAKSIEMFEAGEEVTVNGVTYQGPIEVAHGFRLREISILSLGADASTSANLAARATRAAKVKATTIKGSANMPGFEEWCRSMGFDPAGLTNPQKQGLQNMWQSAQTQDDQERQDAAADEQEEAAEGDEDEKEDEDAEAGESDEDAEEEEKPPTNARRAKSAKQPIAAARTGKSRRKPQELDMSAHRDEIRRINAAEMRRTHAITKECGTRHGLAATAIEKGWSLEKVQLHVLRAERSEQAVIAGPLARPAGGPDYGAIVECSMLSALPTINGDVLKKIDRRYTDDVISAAYDRENRGYTFSRLFGEYLQAHGRHARAGSLDQTTIEAVIALARGFEIRGEPGAGGSSFSTVSLPNILSNLLNKSLLASYIAVPIASDKFCGVQDLNDFKVATRLRLSASGELETVGATGQLKDFSLGEESWTNQLQTKGTKLVLNRQMLINDDLDAFTNIPRLIGRKTALAIERSVFTQLLLNPTNANGVPTDSNAFFSAAHNNYLSGAGSAFGIAALNAAVPLFLKQTDTQGEPIVLAPAYVLVPPELVVLAEQIYKETNVITLLGTSTAAGKTVPQNNPFAGKFKPIESPYLSNGLIPGNSSTGWYLIADPADVPMIAIGYLKGQRTPTVSQAMTDIEILGFAWQCFFDFGVGSVDWRAGVFNAGV